MLNFAAMLAGRYGPQPYPGPIIVGLFIVVAVVACISAIVNRKKLDEIKKEAQEKNEPPKPVGDPWKCPKCGEELEPQFESCWKCGAARKDDHAA
jgi:hypothetical protein